MSESQSHEHLLPDRHPQHDLFVCDVADAALKEMTSVLEHPFYSLSKKPETAVRRYQHNGNTVEIVPSVKGMATIYDKDILIYCISRIMAALKRGEKVSPYVKVNTHEFLTFSNRGTTGKDYHAVCDALERLSATRTSTNIRTGNIEQFSTFGLIDAAEVKRTHGQDGRLVSMVVKLSDWVFNAIRAEEVLTLHRDYFRLRKPIERRVYEIARKHCGRQRTWSISLELLHKKSGSKSQLREFRRAIRHLVSNDYLPDYRISLTAKDIVVFDNRETMPALASPPSDVTRISDRAKEVARRVAPGWDVGELECEWRVWMKYPPNNPDAAFIGFCKKWVERNSL